MKDVCGGWAVFLMAEEIRKCTQLTDSNNKGVVCLAEEISEFVCQDFSLPFLWK